MNGFEPKIHTLVDSIIKEITLKEAFP